MPIPLPSFAHVLTLQQQAGRDVVINTREEEDETAITAEKEEINNNVTRSNNTNNSHNGAEAEEIVDDDNEEEEGEIVEEEGGDDIIIPNIMSQKSMRTSPTSSTSLTQQKHQQQQQPSYHQVPEPVISSPPTINNNNDNNSAGGKFSSPRDINNKANNNNTANIVGNIKVSSRVNGLGLWRSWQRNFKTPILALYDLFDNAIDAALITNENDACHFKGKGKIHVSADKVMHTKIKHRTGSKQTGSSGSDTTSRNTTTTTTHEESTGMCMINNCFKKIPPLSDVMEVFKSSKNKSKAGYDGDSLEIGENGVGIKQACASLTDLSIIITRNKNTYSIGLIAASLQRKESCYLPHVVFETDNGYLSKDQMNNVLSVNDNDDNDGTRKNPFYNSICDYGSGSFAMGLHRLHMKCNQLNNRYWGEYDYIFCVVLHNLRHGGHGSGLSGNNNNKNSDTNKQNDEPNYGARAEELMTKLKDELPRHYIHIPTDFEITINHERVKFQYWERNLVELTEFNFLCDPENYWYEAEDWLDPQHSGQLRVFCGFDTSRVLERDVPKACSLYVYARHSGRLIKYTPDARNLLNITAGGTDYAQGLTVIVDDYLGTIPLNPTKQDFAFGQEKRGDIHERNLFDWVSAFTRIFYIYHKKRFSDKKSVLTESVKKALPDLEKVREKIFNNDGDDNNTIKTLFSGEFTTFTDTLFMKCTQRNNGPNIIRHRGKLETIKGSDTHVQLRPCKLPSSAAAKKKKPTNSKKNNEVIHIDDISSSEENLIMKNGTNSRKKNHIESENLILNESRKRKHVDSYAEDSFDDNDGSYDDDENRAAFIGRNSDWLVPTEQAAAAVAEISRNRRNNRQEQMTSGRQAAANNNYSTPPRGTAARRDITTSPSQEVTPETYQSLQAKVLLLESQVRRMREDEREKQKELERCYEKAKRDEDVKYKAYASMQEMKRTINELENDNENLKEEAKRDRDVIASKNNIINIRDNHIRELLQLLEETPQQRNRDGLNLVE